MSYVVDCSIVIRLLSSQQDDDVLRQRLGRTVHAPALIDAEVSSAVCGLTLAAAPRITADRATQMLSDYARLRIVRHPLLQLQTRVFELRHDLNTCDGMYVALAERLRLPLLTNDVKFASSPGHHADVCHYPD